MNIAKHKYLSLFFFSLLQKADLFLLLSVFCTLVPISAEAAEKLTIAGVFSQSGIAAEHNSSLLEMTKFAVKQINNSGGVLGKELDLIVIDNKSTSIGSALAAKKAVELGVGAVIGGHWSSHSLAMAPILQQAGIPMISPSSTNPEVTRKGDYIFRICFVDSFQGKAMAQFARHDLGIERAAVLSNIDEKYSTQLASFFKTSFLAEKGTIVADIGYRGSAADFSEIIMQLKRISPEAIYIPGYTRDSGLFIKQARKMGVQAVFLGGDAWDKISVVAGSDLVGSYQTAAWHEGVPYETSRQLKEIYKKEFKTEIQSSNSPLAYDAVMILKEAIVSCKCTDGEKIRDALMSLTSFNGATGPISFDETGDPANKEVIIVRYSDSGSPVFVKALQQ